MSKVINQPTNPVSPPRRGFLSKLTDGRFLLVSILVHLIFLGLATLWVVQKIYPRAKQNFQGGQRGASQAARSMAYKVSVVKQRNMNTTQVQAKRVTTTGLSPVALPDMPSMPSMGEVAPVAMGGAAGSITGVGTGTMSSGVGGGGAGFTMFGFRNLVGGGSLAGTFYDLKQTSDRKPTGMTPQEYAKDLTSFIKGGWNANHFSKFYKGPNTLYATQIFMPDMDADKGPKAFGLEKEVQPKMWIVLYKGTVTPPGSCTFHFVGHGDDILMVRFDGRFVLAANWDEPKFGIVQTQWKPEKEYDYGWPVAKYRVFPFRKSHAIEVRAGSSYPIEILIGEQPGGRGHADLLIEQEGVEYKKDARGNPILPIFRFGEFKMPPLERGESLPPFAEGGPIWKAVPAGGSGSSVLDMFKR